MRSGFHRRDLLRGLSALTGVSFLGSLAHARPVPAGRTLVLLQLSGGNDGLSTVVPFGDDAYHRARQATRIEVGDVLRLDEHRGLHPALKRLHARYGEGGLAIVEGAGYPDPNRSHFRSLDVWHAADARGRSLGEGWIGRLLRAVHGDDAAPERVVHVGATPPYSLFSTLHPPLAFASPRSYRLLANEDELARLDDGSMKGDEPVHGREAGLELLRRTLRDARASSRAVRAAVGAYEPRVRYPAEPFGDDLRTAAALIHGGLGTRVVSLELGGFDTHGGQRGQHDRLMRTLDAGLSAFLADLEQSSVGREVLVVAFSEFGRRVAENASGGTDHGCAGPMLVAGAAVKGGLHGAPPSLAELDEGGDLVFTTDFRRVYATAIRHVFGIDPAPVLQGRYDPLSVV